MAELTTLARPYAKAAFQYALASQKLAEWSSMTTLLAAVVSQDAVQKVLSSPALTSEQQAKAIIDVCGDELDANAQNFVKALADNKRLPLLTEINELFEALKAEAEKSVDVTVDSAIELNAAIEEQLANALKNKLNCDVNVNSTVDSNLIGGVVIRAGDMIIDASVRGRLAKLAEAVNS